MQEHKLENFLEQYPEIIEEGLQIIERQKRIGNGTGYIDLLCKDKNGKHVIIEIKVEPSPEAVAQVAKYVLALQRKGIPREDIRGMLVTRFIDEETQQLCDYFNIEARGLALGKPKKAYFKAIGIEHKKLEQPNQIQNTIITKPIQAHNHHKYNSLKPPYSLLSSAEISVLKTIINYNRNNQSPTYADISKTIEISMSCIRGHISAIITKGVQMIKKRSINGTIYLYLDDNNPPTFGNIAD